MRKIVASGALTVLALSLMLTSPVAATEPSVTENGTRTNAPAAPAAAEQKGPGCMPDGGCCGNAACAPAAAPEKPAADAVTGGCPCMKARQAAEKPS